MKEDNQKLFDQIDRHLMEDEKPSELLTMLCDEGKLSEYPFSMLARLKKTGQSPKHHPEGNVWNHTMLVTDMAAQLKDKSSDSHVFMWAALLHDIGKPDTTKNWGGKITSYNHDKVGAELAKEFLRPFADDDFIKSVSALVRWHMQILFVVKGMKFAEVEKMKAQTDVNDVALLGKCDRLGRLNPDIELEEKNITSFLNIVTPKEEE